MNQKEEEIQIKKMRGVRAICFIESVYNNETPSEEIIRCYHLCKYNAITSLNIIYL